MPSALDSLRSRPRLLLFGLALGALATSSLFYLRNVGVFSGALERKAKQKLIQEATEEIEKALPQIQVTRLNFSSRLQDLREGTLRSIELSFRERRTGGIEGTLRGTLDIDFPIGFPTSRGGSWKVRGELATELSHLPLVSQWQGRPHFEAEFDRQWTLKTAQLHWEAPLENVAPLGLQLQAPRLDAQLRSGRWSVQLDVKGAEWKGVPAEQRMAQIGPLTLHADGAWHSKNPFPLEASLRLKGGEFLWDERYLDLDLRALPLHLSLSSLEQGHLTLGAPTTAPFRAEWRPLRPEPNSTLQVHFAIAPTFSLEAIAKPFLAWPEAAPLRGWTFKGGQLAATGSFELSPTAPFADHWPRLLHSLQGSLDLRALSGSHPTQKLHWENAELLAPLDLVDRKRTQRRTVRLAIPHFQWRRLKGSLQPTFVAFRSDREGQKFQLAPLKRTLRFENLPERSWSIGPVEALLTDSGWEIAASLRLEGLSLSRALRLACLHPARLPRTELSIRLPKLQLSPESIETDGRIQVEALSGRLTLSDLAIFDPFAPVPELQLNADLRGVSLRDFGNYIHLGEMDGELRASVHDLVLQGLLPTQFDARIEALPQHTDRVTFSIDALRNFVKVMANLDSLPGIANWMAFGPPARLLGDYKLDFAGISVESSEGVIELRSHTPPELLAKEGGKHFILYSPRFKMPLQSRTYPVRVDAPAMANFIARVTRQIEALGDAEKQNTKVQPPAKGTPVDAHSLPVQKDDSELTLEVLEGADREDSPGCR